MKSIQLLRYIAKDSEKIIAVSRATDSEPANVILKLIERASEDLIFDITNDPLAKDLVYTIGILNAFKMLLELPELAANYIKTRED